jgi:DNA-binding NtrC family response regulator
MLWGDDLGERFMRVLRLPEGNRMQVLIVQSRPDLGLLWERHLVRLGMNVTLCDNQTCAIEHIGSHHVDIIVLDLVLSEGAALAVSDFANYRLPKARVIFVTSGTFFSDGSIFAHAANARAFVPAATPPADLAAMIEHYAGE